MGANIVELFRQMVSMSDEEIALIHPKHDRNSIGSLLPRLHYFEVSCVSNYMRSGVVASSYLSKVDFEFYFHFRGIMVRNLAVTSCWIQF